MNTMVAFSITGLLVPIAFLMFKNPLFPNWVIYLWPSSIFLMATDGHERTYQAFSILILSIIVNIILYTILGALFHFIAIKFK